MGAAGWGGDPKFAWSVPPKHRHNFSDKNVNVKHTMKGNLLRIQEFPLFTLYEATNFEKSTVEI